MLRFQRPRLIRWKYSRETRDWCGTEGAEGMPSYRITRTPYKPKRWSLFWITALDSQPIGVKYPTKQAAARAAEDHARAKLLQ